MLTRQQLQGAAGRFPRRRDPAARDGRRGGAHDRKVDAGGLDDLADGDGQRLGRHDRPREQGPRITWQIGGRTRATDFGADDVLTRPQAEEAIRAAIVRCGAERRRRHQPAASAFVAQLEHLHPCALHRVAVLVEHAASHHVEGLEHTLHIVQRFGLLQGHLNLALEIADLRRAHAVCSCRQIAEFEAAVEKGAHKLRPPRRVEPNHGVRHWKTIAARHASANDASRWGRAGGETLRTRNHRPAAADVEWLHACAGTLQHQVDADPLIAPIELQRLRFRGGRTVRIVRRRQRGTNGSPERHSVARPHDFSGEHLEGGHTDRHHRHSKCASRQAADPILAAIVGESGCAAADPFDGDTRRDDWVAKFVDDPAGDRGAAAQPDLHRCAACDRCRLTGCEPRLPGDDGVPSLWCRQREPSLAIAQHHNPFLAVRKVQRNARVRN